jgi:TPR repeat protein
VLFKQTKYADAILPLTELLLINPNDLDVLGNRGFAYVRSGKPREAITDWTMAVRRGSAYAQNELGRPYMMGVPGVLTPNPKTGIELFRLSAAQGRAARKVPKISTKHCNTCHRRRVTDTQRSGRKEALTRTMIPWKCRSLESKDKSIEGFW